MLMTTYIQKILFILSGTILLSFPVFGTIITVDNNASGGGQFTDVPSAISASSQGDTIYLAGSSTSYGTFTLDRKLTIIGAGYNPPTQFNLPSTASNITLGIGSDGSKIMGITVNSVNSSGSTNTNNITIERCNINQLGVGINSDNWVIQNNILNIISLGNNSNILVRNNIIRGQLSSSNDPSVLISNNIFTSTSSGSIFSNVSHAVITNNIFYFGRSPQGASQSTFNNNITYQTANNTLPYGDNSGSGNQVAVNPMFVNAPTGTFDLGNDYQTQAASPANSAGTDGTDIGIYGSVRPFPIGGVAPYIISAPPAVPQIMEMNILNASLNQGDSLQVHIRARKQD